MKTIVSTILLLLAAAAAAAAAGCDRPAAPAGTTAPSADGTRPYKIITTVGMITDVVKQVAGDRAFVTGIIGDGVDPHLYKPTRNDVAALLGADVVMYSGLMLEGKMIDSFDKVRDGGKPVFELAKQIDKSFLLQPPEFEGHPDPHVWMSVPGWMKVVEAAAKSLGEHDPAGAAQYQANAARYLEELKQLDAYARQVIGSIPQQSRILVTAHDAFNYFGREYGIEVKGIQGISTESEAGLQDINALVNLIVSRDVKAVFVESSVAERNVRALIDGASARGKQIRVGGSLYSDAMGPTGTYEGTYIGMVDHNVTTIARALGGNAPEKGLHGKLSAK
ncbi:MAG TPA: zinc ABC transporter substrate-binding protein [Tepidisphaeraceae bacterium]|nr:zinc ABC transporter substrate-binding protein [Tepidisphaeraceae bacterium]